MLTDNEKAARRGRNLFSLNGAAMPATATQKFNPFQLQVIDEIAARPDFDYWVNITISQFEYLSNWTPGVKVVLFYTKDGALNSARIGQKKLLQEHSTKDGGIIVNPNIA